MPKEEEPEEGAPAWLLTYGDMITLVLTFFIMLFAISEIKKPKLTRTMKAFQKQFGVLPKYKATVQVFIQTQRMTETEANVLRTGPPGRHTAVQTIDEGGRLKVVIGGQGLFEPESSELKPALRKILLTDVAPNMKGFKNRIDVRGHTASGQAGYMDLWQLGYDRAYAVMRYLVDEAGIEERRFRVTSCGDNEPRASNLSEDGRNENRRVEVIMTEESIRDMGTVDTR